MTAAPTREPGDVRVVCQRCNGDGGDPIGGDGSTCPNCLGSGTKAAALAPGERERIAREVLEYRLAELASKNPMPTLLRLDGWNLDDNEHSAFEVESAALLSLLFPESPHD